MLNRRLTSSVLAAALLAVPLTFVGCDQNASTTASTPAKGPGEQAGRAVDNAARNTADAAHNAASDIKGSANETWRPANNAANNAANAANNAANNTADAANNAANKAANSSVPGMPSVNGTSTNNMSTADAAAQRLLDNARNNITQKDYAKAKTLLSELKDKGMYDSLSAMQKAKVDALATELSSAPMAQENK